MRADFSTVATGQVLNRRQHLADNPLIVRSSFNTDHV
jgi:hypothetical protein